MAYIAKVLGRSRTTIYNELKRGATIQIKNKKIVEVYLPDKAQLVYEKIREKSRKPLKIHKCSEEFLKYVEDSIKREKWSVDETISRAKKQRMFEIIPSYKTIYKYIEKGILQIKNRFFVNSGGVKIPLLLLNTKVYQFSKSFIIS